MLRGLRRKHKPSVESMEEKSSEFRKIHKTTTKTIIKTVKCNKPESM